MSELAKAYEPQAVEEKWYKTWEESGCFKGVLPEKEGVEAHSIVIPPPNVTGVLHMGHILNNTIQDILTRRARQQGKAAVWVPGTDHAGIATQTRVEKKLREQGKTKWDLGREEFIEEAKKWRDEHGGIILKQLRKLGTSCDWDRTVHTLDEGYSRAVLTAFVGLLAWRIGGLRPMAISLALVLFILLTGFWVPAMMTLYLTSMAVVLCMLIGIPVGIWSARSPVATRIVLTICDTLQTFPSFIYLIPVIMLFRVGDLASLMAIIGYAMVPAIRYTNLGISRVPPTVVEAAVASGTTRRQMLFKVELPMALPEIMLGMNQTVVLALSMTAITALIGSRDLGQEILKALPDLDTGRGLLAGLCIAAIGLIVSQMIESWVAVRKKQLGLSG